MTWVIHKGNRKHLYNIDACKEISLLESDIILLYNMREIVLEFETTDEASQAFSYLRESIKRGENLLNI